MAGNNCARERAIVWIMKYNFYICLREFACVCRHAYGALHHDRRSTTQSVVIVIDRECGGRGSDTIPAFFI